MSGDPDVVTESRTEHLEVALGSASFRCLHWIRERPSEMTRKFALPKLRIASTRPAVVVSTRAASRSATGVASCARRGRSPCGCGESMGVRTTPSRVSREVRPPLLDLFVFLRHTRVEVSGCRRLRTASSTPLMNPPASSVLNRFASSSASSMTSRGVSRSQELVDGEPQDEPIHHRHAHHAPVLGLASMSGSISATCSTVPSARVVANDRLRSDGSPRSSSPSQYMRRTSVHRQAPDLPLVEHLQRALPAPRRRSPERAAPSCAWPFMRRSAPVGSRAAEAASPFRRGRRGFPPLFAAPDRRARSPPRRSWSSARRTQSARAWPPRPMPERGRLPRRCSRNAGWRRE